MSEQITTPKQRQESHDAIQSHYLQMDFEIKRLRFALKCSIEVTDMLRSHIDTMNVVGKRFGIKPLETSPPPAFIKQILEGSGT